MRQLWFRRWWISNEMIMSNCWEFFHSKPVLCSAATCLAWKPAIWINLEYPSDFSLFWRLILLVALPSALAFPQCFTTGVSFGMPSPCFTQLCVLHHVSNGQKPFPKVLVVYVRIVLIGFIVRFGMLWESFWNKQLEDDKGFLRTDHVSAHHNCRFF